MFKKFLKEEKAQGAIEYILLAGGIIVAAVVIFVIYKNVARSAAEKANVTVTESSKKVACETGKELNMSDSYFQSKYGFSKSDCSNFGITW